MAHSHRLHKAARLYFNCLILALNPESRSKAVESNDTDRPQLAPILGVAKIDFQSFIPHIFPHHLHTGIVPMLIGCK